MRNKRLFNHLSLFTVCTVTILSATGCQSSKANESELMQMINQSQQIEIEIATPISEQQGEEAQVTWIQLDQLTTYSTFRNQLEDIMKISPYGNGSKTGICYINLDGEQEGNNTLYAALMNRKFIANFLENDTAELEIQQIINSAYTDVEDSEAMIAAINAYWNLLQDSEPNYFNGSSTINRLEAMSFLARASHQVTDEVGNQAFTDAVGQTDFTDLASLVESDSYLGTSDKSLNTSTASGTITRGEYIYMLISNVFGTNRMNSADIKKASFNDCKDAGDIAAKEKISAEDTNKDYYDSYELKFALNNPDDGCPTRMYQAIVTAQELGILGSDTRWDEGLTKSEAISMYIDAVQAYAKENGYATDLTNGAGGEVEVVDAQKPILDDGGTDNVGGTDFGVEEDEIEAEITEAEGSIDESLGYTIIDIDDKVLYATQACNLRQGPGTDYEKNGSLSYAQEITVNGKVETEDGKVWWVLKSDTDEKQMVSGGLVSETKPVQQTTTSSGGNGSTGGSSQPSGGTTQQPSTGGGNSGSGGGASSGPANEDDWSTGWGGLEIGGGPSGNGGGGISIAD